MACQTCCLNHGHAGMLEIEVVGGGRCGGRCDGLW